nr:hypothetical protein CFP56_09522 [Quercus suber]
MCPLRVPDEHQLRLRAPLGKLGDLQGHITNASTYTGLEGRKIGGGVTVCRIDYGLSRGVRKGLEGFVDETTSQEAITRKLVCAASTKDMDLSIMSVSYYLRQAHCGLRRRCDTLGGQLFLHGTAAAIALAEGSKSQDEI